MEFALALLPSTYTPHNHILYTHSCSLLLQPFSLFTFFSCSFAHVHMRIPGTLIHSEAYSSHTRIIQGFFPTLLPPPPPLPATLPLGSMSPSGLKELAPWTWSALFTRANMWARRTVQSTVRQWLQSLRSGQFRPAFCLSPRNGIQFRQIYIKTLVTLSGH